MQHPRLSPVLRRFVSTAPVAASLVLLTSVVAPTSTQTAIANGDTRTINLYHAHRKDSLSVTFRRNGSYDSDGLSQLNHFLRDWRNDQATRMDPRLFDVIWESQRGAGSSSPVIVLSAYRSPTTNAMLRSRSRAVAKESQHMHGRAMDMRMPDANMHRVREVALRLQRGGVGWYGSSNFVHLDVGSVRAWPRLSYDHLARLFPDGKSVHISSDGRVLPGYEEARAVIAARGGDYVPTLAQVKEKSFLARLFGWEEDEEDVAPVRGRGGRAVASANRGTTVAAAPAAAPDENSSAAAFFAADQNRRNGVTPAPVRVAAAPVPASVAAAPAARAEPPRPETARPAPTARREVEQDDGEVPMPPRRPSQEQIAALITKATPHVPVPPQRPEALAVVAEARRAPEEPSQVDSPAAEAPVPPIRLSAIPTKPPALPPVITRGSPTVAASATAAAGLLAYAPTTQPSGEPTIRKAVPRKPGTVARSVPALAKVVGVRSAQAPEVAPLFAARLDRSNFTGLTSARRISDQTPGSLMGSSITPLRAAARHDPSRLIFAPADAPSAGFTSSANPSRADAFGVPALRQASNAGAGSNASN